MLDDIKCGPVFLSLFVTTYDRDLGIPGVPRYFSSAKAKAIEAYSPTLTELSSRTLNRGLTQLRHSIDSEEAGESIQL